MTNQDTTLTNQDELIEAEFKDMYPYEDMSNWDMNLFKSGYLSATKASESEINSLKERVAELQSDNNKLREALERLDGWLEVRHLGGLMPNEKELLKTTTAQSLAEHGNEVIERRG